MRLGRKSKVDATKRPAQPIANQITSDLASNFAGRCRLAVRGFSPSNFSSRRRFIAIAKLRAVTMHARIPARSVHRKEAGGSPSAALAGTIQAHIDARIANGSAKIVWLKRMSSRNRRQRSHIFNRFPSVYPALIHLVRLSFILSGSHSSPELACRGLQSIGSAAQRFISRCSIRR